jgi:Terminase large subunit, T4likevirus-type, N-terminal
VLIEESGLGILFRTTMQRAWRRAEFAGEERADDGDAVAFARERLGFEADEKQARVLLGGQRGIVNCTRQWGKSTVAAAKAVHRAYTVAGSLVLLLSPSGRQSGEFLRKAGEFVRRLGIKVRGDGDNDLSILLPNGSRIVGLPGNEKTGRGFSAVSLMLIDEAARVSDEFYRAMRPCLAAVDGDLWLMSTPNGKRGFFWDEWAHGGEAWERVQVAGPDCPRISARMLEEEREKGDTLFRQEYLCEFVEREGAVFSQESIEAMRQDFEALKV